MFKYVQFLGVFLRLISLDLAIFAHTYLHVADLMLEMQIHV